MMEGRLRYEINIMKRKRLIFAVLALLMVGPLCLSQDQDLYWKVHWDVNGIYVDQKYTYNQIVAYLGKPKSVEEEKDVDWLLLKYDDGSEFAFLDDYCGGFAIKSNKFRVFTKQIEGGIKVGDPISKIYKIKGASPTFTADSDRNRSLGDNYYMIFQGTDDYQMDDHLMIYTRSKSKDAEITGIELYSPN
jgi:hypothetical protein